MPDYDLDTIDTAFDEFRAAVAPHVIRADLATIATAARHRRRVQAAVAVAAVFAVIAVPSVAVALHSSGPAVRPTGPSTRSGDLPYASCKVDVLRQPGSGLGYDEVSAVAMDSTGRYVVASLPSSAASPGGTRVVRWHDGQPSTLPVPATTTSVTAVNADGTVIGGGLNDGVGGWAVHGDTFSELPRIGDDIMTPTAIDDAGDIVGFALDRYGVSDGLVLWPADGPGSVHVTGPSGSQPGGIDDDGTIVGTASGRPYIWDVGAGHPLVADPARPRGAASAIRDGWVVGYVGPNSSGGYEPVAAIWRLGAGAPTVVTGASMFNAVASDGTAVGTTAGPDAFDAVVYRDGTLSMLPVPAGESGPFQATSIAADGMTIAGNSTDAVLVWHC
jgi:hypothetical protein